MTLDYLVTLLIFVGCLILAIGFAILIVKDSILLIKDVIEVKVIKKYFPKHYYYDCEEEA